MLARAIVAKLFLFLSFALVAGSAQAQQLAAKEPMRVVIVTSNDPSCGDHCPRWISAQGEITMTTPGEFSSALHAMGSDRLPIVINSPGGAVPAALEVGRMVRQRGLDIAVGQTNFMNCEPHDAKCAGRSDFHGYGGTISSSIAVCASSCSLLLAGGVERDVGPRAFVGVHQTTVQRIYYRIRTRQYPDGHRVELSREIDPTRSSDGPEAQTSSVEYEEISAYFREMGIGGGVLPLILATPHTSIHWMTHAELQATNLATDFADARQLVASSLANNQIRIYHAPPGLLAHESEAPPRAASAAASIKPSVVEPLERPLPKRSKPEGLW